MGNIFSGDSQTSVSNNYVKSTDLSNYAKNDTSSLTNYYTKTQSESTYAKQSQLPDLTPYAKKADLATYAPTGNYLSYSDASKNTFNMDADYLSIGNKSKKEIMKLQDNAINFNTSNITFKNDLQSQVLGIQSGSDNTAGNDRDYIRFGRIDPTNNSMNSIIRLDSLKNVVSGVTDVTARVKSPVIFNNDIRFGQDNIYYTLSPSNIISEKCIYLKKTDQSNTEVTKNYTDRQIGKWCES